MFVFELIDALFKLFVDMLMIDGKTLLLWFILACVTTVVFALMTYFSSNSSNTSK